MQPAWLQAIYIFITTGQYNKTIRTTFLAQIERFISKSLGFISAAWNTTSETSPAMPQSLMLMSAMSPMMKLLQNLAKFLGSRVNPQLIYVLIDILIIRRISNDYKIQSLNFTRDFPCEWIFKSNCHNSLINFYYQVIGYRECEIFGINTISTVAVWSKKKHFKAILVYEKNLSQIEHEC